VAFPLSSIVNVTSISPPFQWARRASAENSGSTWYNYDRFVIRLLWGRFWLRPGGRGLIGMIDLRYSGAHILCEFAFLLIRWKYPPHI